MAEAAAPLTPETETTRRCFVTGEVRPKAELVRFVVDPAGRIVPDVAARLPGRGLWLTARRDIVERAVAKRLFARAARATVVVEDGLADRIEALLAARCSDLLGLARRAGQAVAGYVKVRELVAGGGAAVLVEAADGGVDARSKLVAVAPGLMLVDRLSCAELSAALGREHVVHAALAPGRLAAAFVAETTRLAGFRLPGAPRLGKDVQSVLSDGAGAQ
jgi:uncharacterized protein